MHAAIYAAAPIVFGLGLYEAIVWSYRYLRKSAERRRRQRAEEEAVDHGWPIPKADT